MRTVGEWAGESQQRIHESQERLAQLDGLAKMPERRLRVTMERMAQQASKGRHDEADRNLQATSDRKRPQQSNAVRY